MEWLMAIMGIASLVGSLIYGSQQKKQEQETQDYNKELNQTVMDREDNAWQRAVEDRSKSGLSVAGLSQGAGSGGSVSQLQAPQGNSVMANLMQNISGQSFGLASSAYESRKNREIQKDNFEAELRLKKEQLDTDILNAQYQRMKMLAEIQGLNDESIRQEAIYKHNMSIAKGDQKNPLATVYGSSPSEIERLLTGLWNNRDKISPVVDDVKDTVVETGNKIKDNVKNTVDALQGKSITQLSKQTLKDYGMSDSTINVIKSGNIPLRVTVKDNKYYCEYQNMFDQDKDIAEISKQDFKAIYDLLEYYRKNK